MRKKFKYRKKIKNKYFLIIILIILTICLFSHINNHIKTLLPNKFIIDVALKSNNYYSYNEIKNNSLSENIYNYISNKLLKSPTNILKNNLNNRYDDKEVKTISFSYMEKKDILVYIYNSHQGETYSTKYLEDYNIIPDVKIASSMLKDKLENINIPTIVEESNILNYMKQNNLNHAGSYIASRHFLIQAMEKYPNAKLYIDIHRDSAEHSITYKDINGKACARILFVIGLEYDTYKNNLSIVTKLNNIINEKYPGLSRGIMKKEGYGVNGVYNQDLASNVILIEVGGNENNIEEVNNTLDILANVIGEYINEKE